jgi:hypothetical protein
MREPEPSVLIERSSRRGSIRLLATRGGKFVVEIFAPLAGGWQVIDGYAFHFQSEAKRAFWQLFEKMNRRAK